MSDHDPGYENNPKRTEREGEGNREGQRRPSASPNASASSSNVTSPALHAQAHARESPAMLPRTNSSGDTPQRVGLNLGLGRPRGPSADFVSTCGCAVQPRTGHVRHGAWVGSRGKNGRAIHFLVTMDRLSAFAAPSLSIRPTRRRRNNRDPLPPLIRTRRLTPPVCPSSPPTAVH